MSNNELAKIQKLFEEKKTIEAQLAKKIENINHQKPTIEAQLAKKIEDINHQKPTSIEMLVAVNMISHLP